MQTCGSGGMSGTLYVVATPIGNFADITFRALETLKNVDQIIAENVAVTLNLLNHYDIIPKSRLFAYNDHSRASDRVHIISLLNHGLSVAIVSDAGTPLISDPGYKLLREAHDVGINVVHIPGACSIVAAVVCSGAPTDSFAFCGFIPAKDVARVRFLQCMSEYAGTMVFFESARRLSTTLGIMLRLWGDRKGAVCREMTKIFEEYRRSKLSELVEYYSTHDALGEVVLVVHGCTDTEKVANAITKVERIVELCIKNEMSIRDTVDCTCRCIELCGYGSCFSRNKLYAIARDMKHKATL